jgi:hypothetical protein
MKRSSPTKVLETKEATSSHSYEHLSSPPRVARSASGLSMDRPPMSVVAVRRTEPKAGSRAFLEPRSASTAYGKDEEEASVSIISMKHVNCAFQLRPRGKPVCTPSPASSAGSRGRKRSARCLATPGLAVGAISTNLFPLSLPNESLLGLRASPKSSPSGPAPYHGSFSPMESPQTPGVESSLRNLSIQSPNIDRRPVAASSPLRTQTAGSSFKVYHASSPAGGPSFSYTRTAASTCPAGSTPGSKLGMNSPASSKSSPRFAPCTVLRGGESGVASKTLFQQQRPPLHSCPGSLLFSLEGADGDASDDEILATPEQYPSAVEYHPRLSDESTLSKGPSSGNFVCPTMDAASHSNPGRSNPSPRTPLRAHESSSSGRNYRSPHLSLPKFSLTPKITPKGTDLPTANDGLIFLMLSPQASVLSFNQMKPDTSVSSVTGTQQKYKYESTNSNSNSNSLTLTVEGGNAAESFEPGTPKEGKSNARFLPQDHEPSFHVPDHDWGDRSRSVPSCISQGGFLGSSFGSRRTTTTTTPHLARLDHETTAFSGVTSQLFLKPARSVGLLQAMMEADEKEVALNFDENDDLTDDDDDEAFILTAPGVLAEEQEAKNRESIRARQCTRRRYAEPDQTRRSLYSSAQASDASLLGMAIMQHDSSSPSCSRRGEVPGSNLARKTESGARLPESDLFPSPGCYFPMLGSTQSSSAAHNIGLAVDGDGRDLVTPPPDVDGSSASAVSHTESSFQYHIPSKFCIHIPL